PHTDRHAPRPANLYAHTDADFNPNRHLDSNAHSHSDGGFFLGRELGTVLMLDESVGLNVRWRENGELAGLACNCRSGPEEVFRMVQHPRLVRNSPRPVVQVSFPGGSLLDDTEAILSQTRLAGLFIATFRKRD